jgi:molecular chaperone DnaK (HSP70)
MVHIGIDIGTSNTLVAFVAATGEPTIRNIAGKPLLPSVIHVDSVAGYRSVGQDALALWADPDADETGTFRRWKLQMGEGALLRRMPIGAAGSTTVEEITPERLTTWIVEHVLERASHGVGGLEIDSVLVTVPHGWRRQNPEKCRATKESAAAARVAGSDVTVQPVTLSEPVAAAVYWLWQAAGGVNAEGSKGKPRPADDFVGKVVMVVDIGGGTFDLSLVRIGEPGEPLEVVSAANSDYAGDYATALMLARVCRAFNDAHRTDLPATADDVLDALTTRDHPVLRRWFIEVENKFTHELSEKIALSARYHRPAPRPVVVDFRDDDGRRVDVTVTSEEWLAELEPFFDHGRTLVRRFLDVVNESPYAVVFAGGASRIAGVPDRIVAPALGPDNPAVNRIPFNAEVVDQAVALGAALVAAGVVSVREKLLSDVGMIVELPDDRWRRALGVSSDAVLLTPMLRRGSDLPASFRSSDHDLPSLSIKEGESADFRVVIDDNLANPFIQSWTLTHPAGGSHAEVEVALEADTDGRLIVILKPKKTGVAVAAYGQLHRRRSRTSTSEKGSTSVTLDAQSSSGDGIPRVTIEQLRAARRSLHSSAGRSDGGGE